MKQLLSLFVVTRNVTRTVKSAIVVWTTRTAQCKRESGFFFKQTTNYFRIIFDNRDGRVKYLKIHLFTFGGGVLMALVSKTACGMYIGE